MSLQAQTIDEITVPVISDASQLENTSAAYMKELTLGGPVDFTKPKVTGVKIRFKIKK